MSRKLWTWVSIVGPDIAFDKAKGLICLLCNVIDMV